MPIQIHTPEILFDNNKQFQVLDAFQGITKSSSATDTPMCKGWTLTVKEATQVIRSAEPINGVIWHHDFLVLPCIVKGQILQDGRSFKYEINGGSWITITTEDTTIYYGSFIKKNKKYFLEKADDAQ